MAADAVEGEDVVLVEAEDVLEREENGFRPGDKVSIKIYSMQLEMVGSGGQSNIGRSVIRARYPKLIVCY